MGNPFSNLKTDNLEETEDRLGGGYSVKDSDIYTAKVKAFYATQAASGADAVTVILSGGDFGPTEYRETVYITSGKAKGNKNYYEKDGKKYQLPGFIVINEMCLATVGKEISEIEFDDKVMNIYDPEQKKELPKSVKMAVELLGQEVSVAVLKTKENQTEKDNQGLYVPKADGSTREVNNIAKVFNTDSRATVSEAIAAGKAGKPVDAQFWDKWVEKNKGTVVDKTSKDGTAGTNRTTGSAPAGSGNTGGNSGGGASARTSLFGNK